MEVSKLVQAYVEAGSGSQEPQRTLTFSVRLTEYQHAKLVYIAGKFGAAKTRVAQQLLNAAMEEALRSMVVNDLVEAHGVEAVEVMPEEESNLTIESNLEGIRIKIAESAGLLDGEEQ